MPSSACDSRAFCGQIIALQLPHVATADNHQSLRQLESLAGGSHRASFSTGPVPGLSYRRSDSDTRVTSICMYSLFPSHALMRRGLPCTRAAAGAAAPFHPRAESAGRRNLKIYGAKSNEGSGVITRPRGAVRGTANRLSTGLRPAGDGVVTARQHPATDRISFREDRFTDC